MAARPATKNVINVRTQSVDLTSSRLPATDRDGSKAAQFRLGRTHRQDETGAAVRHDQVSATSFELFLPARTFGVDVALMSCLSLQLAEGLQKADAHGGACPRRGRQKPSGCH